MIDFAGSVVNPYQIVRIQEVECMHADSNVFMYLTDGTVLEQTMTHREYQMLESEWAFSVAPFEDEDYDRMDS